LKFVAALLAEQSSRSRRGYRACGVGGDKGPGMALNDMLELWHRQIRGTRTD